MKGSTFKFLQYQFVEGTVFWQHKFWFFYYGTNHSTIYFSLGSSICAMSITSNINVMYMYPVLVHLQACIYVKAVLIKLLRWFMMVMWKSYFWICWFQSNLLVTSRLPLPCKMFLFIHYSYFWLMFINSFHLLSILTHFFARYSETQTRVCVCVDTCGVCSVWSSACMITSVQD